MMLCMCWDDQEVMEDMGESQGQCGTTGAARMAEEAGVKKLVLVHIGPHLSQSEVQRKSMKEVSNIYKGDIVFADELMALEL